MDFTLQCAKASKINDGGRKREGIIIKIPGINNRDCIVILAGKKIKKKLNKRVSFFDFTL